ncbi:MAG: hypothetical protein L0227_11975 [Chloroflexi bacterium]|nr:hypothetical protein [Chloroflexota bacterium]
MSRSVTVPIPGVARVGRVLLVLVAAAVIALVGIRAGLWLVSPGPAAELTADGLAQIQTTSATYVGRIVDDDGAYLRVADPAIIRPESGEPDARLLVQLLTAEPFNVAGEILIGREQVVLVGAVAAGSGLETAYRQATGDLPQPTNPTPAPSE